MNPYPPRTFCTVRTIERHDQAYREYEDLANLIKKYGCIVSKVSDGENWMRIYFEIPIAFKDQFLQEEMSMIPLGGYL